MASILPQPGFLRDKDPLLLRRLSLACSPLERPWRPRERAHLLGTSLQQPPWHCDTCSHRLGTWRHRVTFRAPPPPAVPAPRPSATLAPQAWPGAPFPACPVPPDRHLQPRPASHFPHSVPLTGHPALGFQPLQAGLVPALPACPPQRSSCPQAPSLESQESPCAPGPSPSAALSPCCWLSPQRSFPCRQLPDPVLSLSLWEFAPEQKEACLLL